MRAMNVNVVAAALAVAGLAAGGAARADDLTVVSLEHGPWAATVSALQRDVRSEGRLIHIEARDARHHAVPCGAYTLTLDATGQQAFEVRGCDAGSNLTEIRLANRSALFSHDDVVPRPLTVALTAASVPTETVCRAVIHPSLEDMEHGTRVFLSSPRFALRVLLAGVQATPYDDGWELRGGTRPASVEYDVVDTARNRIALHAQAQLACGPVPLPSTAGATTQVPSTLRQAQGSGQGSGQDSGATCGAVDLVPGVVARGTTEGRADTGHASCGGGAYAPDAVYRLVVPYRANVLVRLQSDYDGVLYLRSACDVQTSELACNDDAQDASHSEISTTLDAGTYFVFVDGYGSQGSQRTRAGGYQVMAQVTPAGGGGGATGAGADGSPAWTNTAASGAASVPVQGDLQSGVSVHGMTVGGDSHYQGACGSGRSPDHVWRLVVRERSQATIRLSSTFDGVLVMRRTLEGHEDDVPCDDDAGDMRHSQLDETLDPGVYFVIVDGYNENNSGEYDLTATLRRP